MNKNYSLLLAVLLFTCAANGQSRYGIKAGVNLADQLKSIAIPQVPVIKDNTKPFVGYQVGVFYKKKLQKHYLISAETNFSVIGSGMDLTTPDGERSSASEKLGYIELPLTIQYSINRMYLGLGPGIGWRIFSKITHFGNRSHNFFYYKAIEASANILAGCAVSPALDVNVRYNHGLSNLYKEPGYARAKNRFLNLSLLYALR